MAQALGYLLAAVVAAVMAAWSTIAVGKRRNSGRISTSEATDLWNESRAIREEQRLDNVSLRQELTAARALVEQSHQDVLTLHEKYGALEEAHKQCKEDLANLTAELKKK